MADRLPLVPKRSTLGGFALLGFLMTAVGAMLFFSYAGGRLSPDVELWIQAGVAAALVVFGGLAVALFVRAR